MSGKHRLVGRAEDALRRKCFHGAGVQDSTEAAGAPKESIQAPNSYLHPGEKEPAAASERSDDPFPCRRRLVGLND
ncbi:hypothetical protein ACFT1B_12515 [Streptomyces griseoincarnatus]